MRTILFMLQILASIVFVGLQLFAAEPLLERQSLFEAGKDDYAIYRIPGIVVTKQETVLANCDARKTGKSDWDTIDIMMRRSTDGASRNSMKHSSSQSAWRVSFGFHRYRLVTRIEFFLQIPTIWNERMEKLYR